MIHSQVRDHVAEVVIDNPPVNALPVKGWFELADTHPRRTAATRRSAPLIVSANPEHAASRPGSTSRSSRPTRPTSRSSASTAAAAETFAAVYDCEVPVIAAVHGYCLGGGIGIAGNADIVVASDDATFGLPEVDRGALGVATHLARLVPYAQDARDVPDRLDRSPRRELLAFGTVERVVPRAELLDTALELAQVIAAKSPLVIRRAKESLNAIDPVDVKRSYRFEQGFTFELNLWGDTDELRQAFVEKRDADVGRPEGSRP